MATDDLARLKELAGIKEHNNKICIRKDKLSDIQEMGNLLEKLKEVWNEPNLKFNEFDLEGTTYIATGIEKTS